MHPYDRDISAEIPTELPDFNPELVWKKVFRKVDCDYCDQKTGYCSYNVSGWAFIANECPKWKHPFANCFLNVGFTFTYTYTTTFAADWSLYDTLSVVWTGSRGIVCGT